MTQLDTINKTCGIIAAKFAGEVLRRVKPLLREAGITFDVRGAYRIPDADELGQYIGDIPVQIAGIVTVPDSDAERAEELILSAARDLDYDFSETGEASVGRTDIELIATEHVPCIVGNVTGKRYCQGDWDVLEHLYEICVDPDREIGDDPEEFERHFVQFGDTPTERHYKRRMYELVAENIPVPFYSFFCDTSFAFVYFKYPLRWHAPLQYKPDMTKKERRQLWFGVLASWRKQVQEQVQERARADAELRALALEMRRLRGTDEFAFYLDLWTQDMPAVMMTLSVFGDNERRLEI